MSRIFSKAALAALLCCLAGSTAAQNFSVSPGIAIIPPRGNRTPLMWMTNGTIAENLTKQVTCSGMLGLGTGGVGYSVFSMAGTLRNLYVVLTVAPGSGNNVTVTVFVNGSSTALTCPVSNAATTCNDTTDSVPFSAGQECFVQVVSSSTAATTQPSGGIEADTQ